jgi:hypothetical protein
LRAVVAIQCDGLVGLREANNVANFFECGDVLRKDTGRQHQCEYEKSEHSFLQDLQDFQD